jgi:hypothetical protein
LFLALVFFRVRGDDCCKSHQFVPRSITTDLVYDDVFNYYERHYNDRQKFIYSGTVLYQKSKKSDRLGSAFLLKNGCNCVDVTQDSPGDINSVWLGLQNNDPNNPFSSKFCIEPERREVGYHSYWYLNLDEWVCGLWVDVATAVINAVHDLNCCEQGNNATVCPGVTTVSEALSNDLYDFGKFFCGPCGERKSRTGLDDIQVRVGYEHDWCDETMNAGLYLIGTIPTGRKPTAKYVFEPLVGSRNGSIGVGLNGDYQFWCDACGDKSLTLMTDANYRYAFSRDICRTFDLCNNGAFSRFLLLAEQDNPTVPLPGVNFLTQNVDVEQRSTIQWWLAMHYEHCDYDFEFGYNLFWRQKEGLKDCLSAPCKTVGVYDLNCAGSGCTSASTATIGTYATDLVADTTFTSITAQDINVHSGLAGEVLSNKLYAAGAWQGSCCDCFDWLAGLGGSYEFVSDKYACNALPKWAVFGRFSLMF